MSVEVRRAPFGFSVRNPDGDVVLSSLDGGDADGFAAVAWTTGTAGYDEFFAPGYTAFFSTLDPWRDRFEVIRAQEDVDTLAVTVRDPTGEDDACVVVVFTVRGGALRVEAAVDGPPRAWAAGFPAGDGEAFLGFGERFNRTDQRGVDVFSWAEEGGIGLGEGSIAGADNPHPSGQAMTYYPVPFFLSTAGYGFWLDTTWRSEFNLDTVRPDAWRAWHVGPTLAYEIYAPARADNPEWPYDIINAFTAATGLPAMPPAWAFGPRRRVNRGDIQAGVPEIQRMRDLDLAVTSVDDALHFYPSASQLGIEDQLADWTIAAHALGYKVNGYYNSFINRDPDSAIADWAAEGEVAGHYVRRADGTYPDLWILTGGETPDLYLVDFTNPAATSWYQSSFDWADDLGYDGWMYDFGEYLSWDAVGFDGRSGEELHNLYPVLYAKAFHDAGREFAFMRSGYTGSSAFVPMAWSGDPAASFEDSDGLPSVVRAAINMGISGVPNWASDIGGFHCQRDGAQAADEELLVRWIQAGSMTSGMQDQDACVGSDSSLKASMWNSAAVMAAWAEYARLHTRLFPYISVLAADAANYGTPIVRHMFLEHPDRPELAAIDDAYYLGPALLVAPVVERGATSRTVDLPAGLYLDWHDQTLITGGQQVTLDAPLDKLPLLLRSGHLVTLLDPTIDTLAEEFSAEVVGLEDVDDVYDDVGLLVDGQSAQGVAGRATLDGAVAAPALTLAVSEDELATCDGCYLIETLTGGLQRVRISSSEDTITAGGLLLENGSGRRLRWDLYIAP